MSGIPERDPLAEIRANVAQVLKPEAFDWWLHHALPAGLGGRTPIQAIGDGDVDLVVAVSRDYGEVSFT